MSYLPRERSLLVLVSFIKYVFCPVETAADIDGYLNVRDKEVERAVDTTVQHGKTLGIDFKRFSLYSRLVSTIHCRLSNRGL